MTRISINGGAYMHPSLPVNAQRCVNQFVTEAGPEGRGLPILPTMGTTPLIDLGALPIRQLKGIDDFIYTVVGNKFYRISINSLSGEAESEELGTLDTSVGNVIMSSNPYQIMLVDGTFGYIYNYEFTATTVLGIIGGDASDTYNLEINGVDIYTSENVATQLPPADLVEAINAQTATTHVTVSLVGNLLTFTGDNTITSITIVESGTGFVAGQDGITTSPGIFASGSVAFSQFQKISDPAFVGGSHVVYIDSYFIYNEPGTSKFYFSQPNEGRIWNAIDVASAESRPDVLVALGQTKGELWAIGKESIEVWFNAANPQGSPFSKRVGSDIDIGCRAPYSVTSVNNVLMWLDSRGFVVQSDESAFFRNQSSGYKLVKSSTEAIDAEIARYRRTDDAIGTTYTDDRGHIMYEITFPTDRKTWVFDANTNAWHEKNYNETTGDNQGYSYSLSQFVSPFQDILVCGGLRDGNLYILSSDYYDDSGREIHRIRTTAPFTNDFKLITVNSFELKIDTGNAPQGVDPQIILTYSNDSAHTWSNEIWRSMGKVGEYRKRLTWNRLGTAWEWVLGIKITAPVKYAIIDATANITAEEQE